MTLNRVMALILPHLTDLGSFRAALRKVVEDIHELSAAVM